MIKNKVTLKQLEAFTFVVDTGTFRAAAAELGTTQPNISSRIAALEYALGVTLLYRDAGSVRLTAKGESLLAETRSVLRATEALLEEAGRKDLVDERLRLGVTELVACTWLQRFLRELNREYPSLRIELLVDLSTQIEEKFLEGQLDLAVQNGPLNSPTGNPRELLSEDYVWVASPDVASTLSQGENVERFFSYAVLTHAPHTTAAIALNKLAIERGLDLQKIVHSSALSACIPMACEGLGVALLPRALVQDEVKNKELLIQKSDWNAEPLRFFARFHADRAPRFVARACEIAVQIRSPH